MFKNKKFNEETIGIAAPIPGASCLLEAKQLTLSHASHPNTQNQLSEAPIIARWQSQDEGWARTPKSVLGPFAGLPSWYRQVQVANQGHVLATQR